jgi:hypothetical protein
LQHLPFLSFDLRQNSPSFAGQLDETRTLVLRVWPYSDATQPFQAVDDDLNVLTRIAAGPGEGGDGLGTTLPQQLQNSTRRQKQRVRSERKIEIPQAGGEAVDLAKQSPQITGAGTTFNRHQTAFVQNDKLMSNILSALNCERAG